VSQQAAPQLRPVTPLGLAVQCLEEGRADDALALLRGLDDYLGVCTSPPSDALASLARNSDHHVWSPNETLEAEMLSGHVEGQLLAMLVRLTSASVVLDVGTFTGYSALAMAEAVGAAGRVVTCELDAGVAGMAWAAFERSEAGSRIDIEIGPALDTLARLASQGVEFDLAFLDADKCGYIAVFDALLEASLIRPGGLIVADNTLLQGQPYAEGVEVDTNGKAIARFNSHVAKDDRVEQVLLPVRDGVTLARVLDE